MFTENGSTTTAEQPRELTTLVYGFGADDRMIAELTDI
jgi:hypothetical protein